MEQKLLHVDHLTYEKEVIPLLHEGWTIQQITSDHYGGIWIVLAKNTSNFQLYDSSVTLSL